MRTLRRLCLTLLVGAVIAGAGAACARPGNGTDGTGSPTGTGAASPTTTGVAVTVTRGGGFAGVNQSIAVAADGSWVYTDKRKQSTENGTLTEAQRAELARLAGAPGLFAELSGSPYPMPSCADAFTFEIVVAGRSGGFTDCGGQPRPAVDALLAFLADATPL